jgi:hypothetical protein
LLNHVAADLPILEKLEQESGDPRQKDSSSGAASQGTTVKLGMPPPIGAAKMLRDRTIVLDEYLESPAGDFVEVRSIYKVGDPHYREELRRLGGLKPGEVKPVPPWPGMGDQVDQRR